MILLPNKSHKIVVPHGVQKVLAEMFGISRPQVSNILSQRRRGKKTKNVLEQAMKMGGYWERKY